MKILINDSYNRSPRETSVSGAISHALNVRSDWNESNESTIGRRNRKHADVTTRLLEVLHSKGILSLTELLTVLDDYELETAEGEPADFP